ncbi:MAG: hypothetical protein ACLTQM_12820 [Ruminococcus bicirculans (ex Wegman et al. 2014)]|uniref:hypothetical protein n=1 Tax=Ruminococcus bicirculans (ex Wegman et al. 2014) TaxID=1160721 RepID=UPI003994BFFC
MKIAAENIGSFFDSLTIRHRQGSSLSSRTVFSPAAFSMSSFGEHKMISRKDVHNGEHNYFDHN